MSEVIPFPVVPRHYQPHVTLLERIRKSRESKMRVQEMTDLCRAEIWRKEQVAQFKMLCRALARHPDGGVEFAEMAALAAIEDVKQITV